MEYNLERKASYLISQWIRSHSCKEFTQLMEARTSIKYSAIATKSCENWAWDIWIIKIITISPPPNQYCYLKNTFNNIFLIIWIYLKSVKDLKTHQRIVKDCPECNQVGTEFTFPFTKYFLICNKSLIIIMIKQE